MNIRFLEAFVWVARLGSFKAAADKLDTTQAATSARIATLEDQFGVRLFERDKRHVALTNTGAELVKHAEEILAVLARMLDAVAERASHRGTFVVRPPNRSCIPGCNRSDSEKAGAFTEVPASRAGASGCSLGVNAICAEDRLRIERGVEVPLSP